MGFQYLDDAERFRKDLAERLEQFSLELHPDKTRLLEFGRFASRDRQKRGERKPETFSFLGFTHVCGVTRAGKFMVLRLTDQKRMTATLKRVQDELMRRRHHSIPAQGAWLGSAVRGYFGYFAVPLNFDALVRFYREVQRHWLRALRRRSQKHRMTWERFERIYKRWLPKPRILHPWPSQRLHVTTFDRSPVR